MKHLTCPNCFARWSVLDGTDEDCPWCSFERDVKALHSCIYDKQFYMARTVWARCSCGKEKELKWYEIKPEEKT